MVETLHKSTELFSTLYHSIIKTEGRAMEVVTHFVNDTVEFYKWSLTIAGESLLLLCLDQVTFLSLFESVNVYLSTHASTFYIGMKLMFYFHLQTKGWRTGQ